MKLPLPTSAKKQKLTASSNEGPIGGNSTSHLIRLRQIIYSWVICLQLLPGSALAQYYDLEQQGGPTVLQKLMTSSAATLIMVLVGSAGLFNLFFVTGKGDRSDRKQLIGLMCCLLVVGMCWYRFSLWNDPQFNAKPH